MIEDFMRQLLTAFIRRRAEANACCYYVVVRTSASVSPAAYCVSIDEAQRKLSEAVENCVLAGYTVVARDLLSATLMSYLPDLDIFLTLKLGIEQAPYVRRAGVGSVGFTAN